MKLAQEFRDAFGFKSLAAADDAGFQFLNSDEGEKLPSAVYGVRRYGNRFIVHFEKKTWKSDWKVYGFLAAS